jgi:hypothetical protein
LSWVCCCVVFLSHAHCSSPLRCKTSTLGTMSGGWAGCCYGRCPNMRETPGMPSWRNEETATGCRWNLPCSVKGNLG